LAVPFTALPKLAPCSTDVLINNRQPQYDIDLVGDAEHLYCNVSLVMVYGNVRIELPFIVRRNTESGK
jgi:hypothetical protein